MIPDADLPDHRIPEDRGTSRTSLGRDLADVLHYFLPELDEESHRGGSDAPSSSRSNRLAPETEAESPGRATAAPLPVLGIPIGDRDVMHAALTWNLAVETARLGRQAIVLAPESDAQTPLWPARGVGPLGSEVLFCPASDLEALGRSAAECARERALGPASRGRSGGTLFVRVPIAWIERGDAWSDPIPWWLLMSSSDRRHLEDAYRLGKAIRALSPEAEIGVTIHGVSNVGEARRAYEHVSRLCQAELDLDLISYGLLVDDLHVYRAIAAQRAIGLAHPQAPATRALMDVARLIDEDARSRVLG